MKVFVVYEMDGAYPQSVTGSGVVFSTRAAAQDYADAQYEAQSNSPYYPAKWWYISKVIFANVPEAIEGYPATTGTLPNTPTDLTVTTDSEATFTISWTPDSPASPEVYLVNAYVPDYLYGGNPTTDSYNSVRYSEDNITDSSINVVFTAMANPGISDFPRPGGAGTDLLGSPVMFTVTAKNSFGSSTESDPSEAVTLYGSTPVPAAPENVIVTLTTPGSPLNTYTMTWDQPYPSGAGTPTGWHVGNFNGLARTLGGTAISAYVDDPTTGTPTTGSYQFQASSTNLNLAIGEYEVGNIYAYNDTGTSVIAPSITEVS